MNEAELKALLDTMGIDVAYDHFTTKKQPPFILFRNDDTDVFFADNKTYFANNSYIVDLVTEIKTPALEKALENIFDAHDIAYEKQEDFIESEQIYQIRFLI